MTAPSTPWAMWRLPSASRSAGSPIARSPARRRWSRVRFRRQVGRGGAGDGGVVAAGARLRLSPSRDGPSRGGTSQHPQATRARRTPRPTTRAARAAGWTRTAPRGSGDRLSGATVAARLAPAQQVATCRGSPYRQRLEHLAREARKVGIARAHDEHGVARLRLAQRPLTNGVVVAGVPAAHLGGEVGRQGSARDVLRDRAAGVEDLGVAEAVLRPEQPR